MKTDRVDNALRHYDYNTLIKMYPPGSEGREAILRFLEWFGLNAIAGYDKGRCRIVCLLKDWRGHEREWEHVAVLYDKNLRAVQDAFGYREWIKNRDE